jgi:hypothetical protein
MVVEQIGEGEDPALSDVVSTLGVNQDSVIYQIAQGFVGCSKAPCFLARVNMSCQILGTSSA